MKFSYEKNNKYPKQYWMSQIAVKIILYTRLSVAVNNAT